MKAIRLATLAAVASALSLNRSPAQNMIMQNRNMFAQLKDNGLNDG